MLVLTRKPGQKLRIGNNIIITVLDHTSEYSKVGIEAPREIPIYREEVYLRIQKENHQSVVAGNMNTGILDFFLPREN